MTQAHPVPNPTETPQASRVDRATAGAMRHEQLATGLVASVLRHWRCRSWPAAALLLALAGIWMPCTATAWALQPWPSAWPEGLHSPDLLPPVRRNDNSVCAPARPANRKDRPPLSCRRHPPGAASLGGAMTAKKSTPKGSAPAAYPHSSSPAPDLLEAFLLSPDQIREYQKGDAKRHEQERQQRIADISPSVMTAVEIALREQERQLREA